MNQTNNIIKCDKCDAPLIYEEIEIHQCCTKKLVEWRFDTGSNKYYMFDGNKWYRWFPNWLKTPKSKHLFSTPDDETEPQNILRIIKRKKNISSDSFGLICGYQSFLGFGR